MLLIVLEIPSIVFVPLSTLVILFGCQKLQSCLKPTVLYIVPNSSQLSTWSFLDSYQRILVPARLAYKEIGCQPTITYFINRRHQGRGGTQERPPSKLKKDCCRKKMLFPKAVFFAINVPKINKNSIFLMNFYQEISKMYHNFPTICIFRPNARKINAGFLKLC